MSLIPITVMAGYLRFSLLNKLNEQLRTAYEDSAQIACEQVAAIRTVASLNREIALHSEYMESLKAPVRRAMYSTMKSTLVSFLRYWSDNSGLHLAKVWVSSRMHLSSGTVARFYETVRIPSPNSSSGMILHRYG